MSQVCTMKLTASNACTVKVNIKETFIGKNGFPANVCLLNGLHSENKRPIA